MHFRLLNPWVFVTKYGEKQVRVFLARPNFQVILNANKDAVSDAIYQQEAVGGASWST